MVNDLDNVFECKKLVLGHKTQKFMILVWYWVDIVFYPIPPNTIPIPSQYHPNTIPIHPIFLNFLLFNIECIGMVLGGIWCIGWYWVYWLVLGGIGWYWVFSVTPLHTMLGGNCNGRFGNGALFQFQNGAL